MILSLARMDLDKLFQRAMDQDNGALNISDDGLQMMKEQMQNVRFHHNDTHCIKQFALYISSH